MYKEESSNYMMNSKAKAGWSLRPPSAAIFQCNTKVRRPYDLAATQKKIQGRAHRIGLSTDNQTSAELFFHFSQQVMASANNNKAQNGSYLTRCVSNNRAPRTRLEVWTFDVEEDASNAGLKAKKHQIASLPRGDIVEEGIAFFLLKTATFWS